LASVACIADDNCVTLTSEWTAILVRADGHDPCVPALWSALVERAPVERLLDALWPAVRDRGLVFALVQSVTGGLTVIVRGGARVVVTDSVGGVVASEQSGVRTWREELVLGGTRAVLSIGLARSDGEPSPFPGGSLRSGEFHWQPGGRSAPYATRHELPDEQPYAATHVPPSPPSTASRTEPLAGTGAEADPYPSSRLAPPAELLGPTRALQPLLDPGRSGTEGQDR
jgi:hypothetical protein